MGGSANSELVLNWQALWSAFRSGGVFSGLSFFIFRLLYGLVLLGWVGIFVCGVLLQTEIASSAQDERAGQLLDVHKVGVDLRGFLPRENKVIAAEQAGGIEPATVDVILFDLFASIGCAGIIAGFIVFSAMISPKMAGVFWAFFIQMMLDFNKAGLIAGKRHSIWIGCLVSLFSLAWIASDWWFGHAGYLLLGSLSRDSVEFGLRAGVYFGSSMMMALLPAILLALLAAYRGSYLNFAEAARDNGMALPRDRSTG